MLDNNTVLNVFLWFFYRLSSIFILHDFISTIFKPLIRKKNKIITYLDDFFIQDTTTDTTLQTLTEYHTILENENLKAAPDKSFFFLDSIKFLGHQIQNTHIHPLKSKIDGFLKLQPPKNKTEIQNYVGFLTFISKFIYNLQVILQPFYLQLRDTTDFKWTPELQQRFDRVKKEFTDGTLRLASPNSEKPSIFSAMPLTMAVEQHSSKKINLEKMELVSANSRLFSTTELRLSTILRECSAIIYAISEYEFLIQGSKHPIIFYTDHKPILFLFTQKNKPIHRVYKFQLRLMKYPNPHIVWTEGKNFSLPDLLSSLKTKTQDKHLIRTVEI